MACWVTGFRAFCALCLGPVRALSELLIGVLVLTVGRRGSGSLCLFRQCLAEILVTTIPKYIEHGQHIEVCSKIIFCKLQDGCKFSECRRRDFFEDTCGSKRSFALAVSGLLGPSPYQSGPTSPHQHDKDPTSLFQGPIYGGLQESHVVESVCLYHNILYHAIICYTIPYHHILYCNIPYYIPYQDP